MSTSCIQLGLPSVTERLCCRRLGLLAAVLGNGDIHVIPVPHPATLDAPPYPEHEARASISRRQWMLLKPPAVRKCCASVGNARTSMTALTCPGLCGHRCSGGNRPWRRGCRGSGAASSGAGPSWRHACARRKPHYGQLSCCCRLAAHPASRPSVGDSLTSNAAGVAYTLAFSQLVCTRRYRSYLEAEHSKGSDRTSCTNTSCLAISWAVCRCYGVSYTSSPLLVKSVSLAVLLLANLCSAGGLLGRHNCNLAASAGGGRISRRRLGAGHARPAVARARGPLAATRRGVGAGGAGGVRGGRTRARRPHDSRQSGRAQHLGRQVWLG